MSATSGEQTRSISIHALLAESDYLVSYAAKSATEFLSTLSLRRATTDADGHQVTVVEFLSTLSLRRATALGEATATALKFLSTLSLRRATPL